ncbi:hypothetical protein [Nocardioides lianchengensis]|uniref:Uncharacterized protein n=1 Tax=Nocardioides lianchengensis TaxID=1045774 RepID=A0A1G6Q689_9ACTN|nr:hypothetical protein [Nocardioides lianchengensis]NYG12107.1 hypothetical protein [Nocardioides lianchengensis]SDC87741.1 hypothetical protein SAMN05421872_104278 [Nocardioides lianchengensis]
MTDEPRVTDRYDDLVRLADVLDRVGAEVRARSELGDAVLGDPAVAESAELAPPTWSQVEEDVRAATGGRQGLRGRSLELDADAVVLRATVLTYRWIDELQRAAYETIGTIAGRAIGYLAPEVALGGAIVSAGLIETDALDRDDVAGYLGELAENNPELMDHVSSGGGGLLDGLRMRSLLTSAALAGDAGAGAARAGMRALGAGPFDAGFGPALRDVAGGLTTPAPAATEAGSSVPVERLPGSISDLMRRLGREEQPVAVERLGPGRYVGYLPGPTGGPGRRLRLVGGDLSSYSSQVVRALEAAVAGDDHHPHVLLVGSGQGGMTATEIAVAAPSAAFTVDQVVTAGAPSAQLPLIPDGTHVLSVEDRSDPVVLLGSLLNAGAANRVTVVFDSREEGDDDVHVAGGLACDAARHPELVAVVDRLRALGYLSA